MNDTLKDGDHLLIEKVSYRFSTPERYDIIVFKPYKDDPECYYIKRVIALPGETVRILNGKIYVNGSKLDEEYGLEEYIYNSGIVEQTLILKDDEYFVMGDNRSVSMDSRDYRVGPVSGPQIIGRAVVDFWPYSSFDFFE